MKKSKIIVALLLALLMMATVVLTACDQHECTSPCETCGKCTNATCTDPVCLDKCQGHKTDPDHTCENKCPECSGCLDATCTETACATKCSCPVLGYKEGTELKVSIAHDKLVNTITFADSLMEELPDGSKGLVLADGKTYRAGDLKPVWAEVQNRLKITFNNVYTKDGNVSNTYKAWRTAGFEGVDVLLGNASQIVEDGKKGEILNLADYWDQLPNLKAFLDANPLVQLSVISDTESGAVYYAPYFDGYNDIERYFLCRKDWVEKLLDGEGDFTNAQATTLATIEYESYMPTSGKVVVDGLNADGTQVIEITKDYDAAGNIIVRQNALATKDGVALVNELRDYIDVAYNGLYGTKRSDLFCGYNAAWDADELVALLRCVMTNSYALNGTDKIYGIFPRETRLDREANLLSMANMFGIRGVASNQDYLYFDSEGNLQDARQDEAFYNALDKMNTIYNEGLIMQDFHSYSGKIYEDMYKKNLGFMCFDYCQTQTLYNEYKRGEAQPEDFNFTAIMNPVALWQDGTEGGEWMRFVESWRGVKTQGWCINADIASDPDKLAAALALVDYPWSAEGSILMTYGPEAFIDGTTEYKGQQIPKMSEQNLADFDRLGGGNFTDYARKYLGTTLGIGFVKDQGFEYQCTTANGRAGASIVGQGIAMGVIKHIGPELSENMFYTQVPTTLPTTSQEDDLIAGLAALSDNFSKSNGEYGCYIDIITNGLGGETSSAAIAPLGETLPATAADFAALVSGDMGGATYEYILNQAWQKALEYYESLAK